MADHLETKIRKGQAMNLAISRAVHEDRGDDVAYIYRLAMAYMDIIDAFQNATMEELKEILDASD